MIVDTIVYWIFRLIILLGRPFPPAVGYFFARIIADICYFFFFGKRRALKAAMARVLDTDDEKAISLAARSSFRNFGKYVIDFIHFLDSTPEEVRRRIVFEHFERFDQAIGEKRGIIFITLHYGNWDMGAAGLAAYGYPVNVVAETFPHRAMNALVQGSRRHLGMKVMPMERVGPSVIRALRKGETLALLIDVPEPGGTVRVDFFGAPTEVPVGPARIALRSGARVIPGVVMRVKGEEEKLRPVMDFDLTYERTNDEDEDVRRLTQAIMSSLERLIRLDPTQWFIFHDMWNRNQKAARAETALASRS
jgi:KDO2-lipid IV(A) lauroyltransferase